MAKKANELMLDKLLEVSVADVYFYDEVSGVEMYSATLTNHKINQTGSTEDLKAGRDNVVVATISKSKDFNFEVTDLISRLDMESFKYGGTVKDVGSDIVNAFHMPKNYIVKTETSTKKVTLDFAPLEGEEVMVYNLKTNTALTTGKFTLNGTEITITDETILEGDQVLVGGFYHRAKANDKYFDISTDSTTPTMMAVLEVPLYLSDMSLYGIKQYIFPKVSLSIDVESSGQSEKTAPSNTTKVTVMKSDKHDYLGRVVLIKPETIA